MCSPVCTGFGHRGTISIANSRPHGLPGMQKACGQCQESMPFTLCNIDVSKDDWALFNVRKPVSPRCPLTRDDLRTVQYA
eukprot:2759412-Rhodomonas_salina.1